MDIIIPTYGRVNAQETLRQLLSAGLLVHLVVQDREKELYKGLDRNVQLWVLPEAITTISHTRQWILERVGSDNNMVMMDDDLTFFKRRTDDRTKFEDCTPEDIQEMLEEIDDALDDYAHVGIAAREGGNRNTEGFVRNTRIMRVLGYRRDVLLKERVRFDAMEVMEDFHVALTLLELGYANVICNNWCQNQAGSGKSGGCSHFRTPELHAFNAHQLATVHEPFVKVVTKLTKEAWGGGARTDVQISWKKAYGYGVARHGARILD